jgi:SAM-dependent methyltransferase
MGSGKEQGQLWSPGARDWADYNEPMCTPFYEAVLDATGVTAGTRLLDVGCGGGFALLLAAGRGAVVSGLDAAASLLDIARERVPGASLTTADLEEPLPYPEGAFDVVTSFNSVQYAADPVAALKHMSHVTRPGGLISFLVWGPPDKCQSGVIFADSARCAACPMAAPQPSPGARTASSKNWPHEPGSLRSPSRTYPTR